MYNRYIPQSDGSYQRNRLPDKSRRVPERRPQQQTSPCPPHCHKQEEEPAQIPIGVGSFLKNLLPKDFDTEDLLVILMLLLMSKDEDRNFSLLTLALYLFL